MKEKLTLFIKGFLIGIANIIPGVSGGTMAVSFGIYEKLIEIASNIFKNFKKNMQFLFPIFLGAGCAIVILSGVISYSLTHYPVATPLFFIGLILGGLPFIYKKIGKNIQKPKNMFCFLLVLVFFFLLNFVFKKANEVTFDSLQIMDYVRLFLVGVIASSTMVIPGISGSFVLMLLGYYQPILNVISSLVHFENFAFHFSICLCFAVGVLIGIVVIAKIVRFCFNRYKEATYSVIIAFVIGSIFTIIYPLFQENVSILEIIVGMVLFVGGFCFSYLLEKKSY